jgi:hypothetical protein
MRIRIRAVAYNSLAGWNFVVSFVFSGMIMGVVILALTWYLRFGSFACVNG